MAKRSLVLILRNIEVVVYRARVDTRSGVEVRTVYVRQEP